jgi:hypothetical protein
VDDYSKEFKYWYERIYLQSPSLCKLEYDDEKMWEAWQAALRSEMFYKTEQTSLKREQ